MLEFIKWNLDYIGSLKLRVPYVSSNLGKMALNDLFFFSKFGYIIITSNGGDMLVNGININDLA